MLAFLAALVSYRTSYATTSDAVCPPAPLP
jgi:hypothetical protein